MEDFTSRSTTGGERAGRRPVLVCVDDRSTPDAAFHAALDVAVRQGRGLRLAHVMPTPHGTGAQEWPLLDFRSAELVAHEVLDSAADRLRHLSRGAVDVTTALRTGSVTGELCGLAMDAHLVVLTRRRHTAVRRVFTGSTTADVAAHSPVPVRVVPEHWTPRQHDPVRVTVGVARWHHNRDLLAHAVEEAVSQGGDLEVVHACAASGAYEAHIDLDELAAWEPELHDQVREAAAAGTVPKVDVRIAHGRAADLLVDASRTAELVVVGRTSYGRLGGLTRALLREAHSPVEVVPPVRHGAPTAGEGPGEQ